MNADAEWQECRTTIGRFDGFAAALRTFAFGLVTTLITLGAFLADKKDVVFPPAAKVVTVGAIVILITAAFWLDRYYCSLTMGAVERALDLEQGDLRNRPPALTGIVTRNALRSLSTFATVLLYLGLIVGAVSLGYASISSATAFDVSRLGTYLGDDLFSLLAAIAGSVAFVLVIWYAAIKLTADIHIIPGELEVVSPRTAKERIAAKLGLRQSIPEDRLYRDEGLESGLLSVHRWALAFAALLTLCEILSGSHLLRLLTLSALFGTEAVVGHFFFLAGRNRLLALRQPIWRNGVIQLTLNPPIAQPLLTEGRPRVRLVGARFANAQTTIQLWLDDQELNPNLVTLWQDDKIEVRLPRRDPRYNGGLWMPGDACIQLRATDRVLAAASLRLDYAFVSCLNMQLPDGVV